MKAKDYIDIDSDKSVEVFNKKDFANAIKCGDVGTVENIIKKIGDDTNQLTDFIKEASYDPSYPVVKYGRDENNSALASAARSGHAEAIQLLLDAGKKAGVMTRILEECGLDASQNAAVYGHATVVKLLLNASQEVALSKTLLGRLGSAFIIAAEHGYVKTVECFLDKAKDTKDTKVMKEMLKCGQEGRYPAIVNVAHHGSLEILKLLLDAAEEAGVTDDMRSAITKYCADQFASHIQLGEIIPEYYTVRSNVIKIV
jgi:hypothetical protein